MVNISFLPKTYIRILLPRRNTLLYILTSRVQRQLLMLPDSSKILIIAISTDSVVSVRVEFDCQRQQTHCLRLYFQDFAIANLFMILVVSVSHRSSCSILFRIRPFSLFVSNGAPLFILPSKV